MTNVAGTLAFVAPPLEPFVPAVRAAPPVGWLVLVGCVLVVPPAGAAVEVAVRLVGVEDALAGVEDPDELDDPVSPLVGAGLELPQAAINTKTGSSPRRETRRSTLSR